MYANTFVVMCGTAYAHTIAKKIVILIFWIVELVDFTKYGANYYSIEDS